MELQSARLSSWFCYEPCDYMYRCGAGCVDCRLHGGVPFMHFLQRR